MLILLPPSEGKSAPIRGPRLRPSHLSFPELTATRSRVLASLIDLCTQNADRAAGVLDLGPTQRAEIDTNAGLRTNSCAPASDVYTGVLYEALDAGGLSPTARRRLQESVAICSALWGLVRPDDPIPAYRLSGGTVLPDLGSLASVWRPAISGVLEQTSGLIVDMRSSAYVALGPVPESAAHRAVTVRVLTENKGRRTVVSHNNKATKGLLVRSLMSSRRRPKDVESLAEALAGAGYEVEVSGASAARPAVLDVILH